MLLGLRDSYRRSLRFKILVPTWGALALVITTLSFFAGALVEDGLQEADTELARRQAMLLASDSDVRADLEQSATEHIRAKFADAFTTATSAIAVAAYAPWLEGSGYRLVQGDAVLGPRMFMLPPFLGNLSDDVATRRLRVHGMEVLVVTAPVVRHVAGHPAHGMPKAAAADPCGAIALAYTLGHAAGRATPYHHLLMFLSIALLLFGTLAANQLAENILLPITALQAGLERVTAGHLDHRIAVCEEDEVAIMADRFNVMTEQLEASQRQIQDQARLLETRVAERTMELQRAYRELQTLDHAKDMFLSSVSHEMRTPLTSILASVEILRDFTENDPATRREFLDIIGKEGQRLLDLIADMMDLAKIEARALKLDLQQHDLSFLLDRALDDVMEQARGRRVTFSIRKPDAAALCRCDSERIGKVIRHLLENAIRSSPEDGTVHVGISHDHDQLALRVRDEGRTIPHHERDSLFEAFAHAAATASESRPAGIGLAVGLRIAQIHGGALSYEEGDEPGPMFVLRLPLPDEGHDSPGSPGAAHEESTPPASTAGGAPSSSEEDGSSQVRRNDATRRSGRAG